MPLGTATLSFSMWAILPGGNDATWGASSCAASTARKSDGLLAGGLALRVRAEQKLTSAIVSPTYNMARA